MGGFWGVLGGIVGAVVGAIAAIPLIPAIVVGVVGGVVLCVTGLVCPVENTANNTGNNVPSGVTITSPQNTNNGGRPGGAGSGGGSGVGGGNVGRICTSSPNPVCGITNQGVEVNGVCNATVPPNSACPAPIIDGSRGFYPEPALVKNGEQSTLKWNVENATLCAITGGSLNLLGLGISGSNLTGSITQKTTYTLTCINGEGGPSSSANATVNLVPSFQEI